MHDFKAWQEENGQFILRTTGKIFEIIRPKEPISIYAVVTASLRMYKSNVIFSFPIKLRTFDQFRKPLLLEVVVSKLKAVL